MKNKIRILLIAFLLVFVIQTPISEATLVVAADAQAGTKFESKTLDPRAEMLSAYLAKHNSPLQFHAQDFVDAADQYKMDWKLVAAISGVESTFGKRIPGGYNGWGWGVYGDKSLGFESWRDGIFTVSKGLRVGYLDKGLTDPYAINKKYAASKTWGRNVTFFLNDITKFEQKYQLKNNPIQLAYLDINTYRSGNVIQLSTQLP